MSIKKIMVFVLAVAALCGCDNRKTLHVYTWSDYVDPDFLVKFEHDNDCHVVIDTFDSNEAAYAKLKAGGSGYDIVIPSSYQVQQLANDGLLAEIDAGLIPNVITYFDHRYDGFVFNGDFRISVPYAVTYTGFMYIREKAQRDSISANVLSDIGMRQKVTLLDDIREVIGLGLMYNGYSINSSNTEEIVKATKTVLEWKKNVRKFDAESYKTEISSGSIWLGHGYSSDAGQVILGETEQDARSDISFALPAEGFTVAWDEFVILKTAQEKELAHKFINDLYEPSAACANMQYICALMSNTRAIEDLPARYRDFLVLDDDTLKRGQVLRYIPDPRVIDAYNAAWDKIRAIK